MTTKRSVCVRLSDDQLKAIAMVQDCIEAEDGWRQSRSAIVMRMVDFGIDYYEKKYPEITKGKTQPRET